MCNKGEENLKKENDLSFLGGSFGCRLPFAYIGMAQSMPIIVYCKKRYCLLFIVYWHSLHHDKVKGRKSAGNFRDERGIGNNSAGG